MGPLLEVRWIWSWSWSWIDSGTRGRWHQWTLDFWLDFWYWATLGWVDWLSLTCEENYRVNIDKYFCNLYQLWNYHHGPVLVAYLHGRDIQFSCVPQRSACETYLGMEASSEYLKMKYIHMLDTVVKQDSALVMLWDNIRTITDKTFITSWYVSIYSAILLSGFKYCFNY